MTDGPVTNGSAHPILWMHHLKLDALLRETKQRLEVIEGLRCNRYPPEFNIANHPYWRGVPMTYGGHTEFWLVREPRG